MSYRRALSVGGTVVVTVAVGSLLIGSLLGQPILLSYVTTDSMQPTIDPGDGFVAVPKQVAGPIEKGDVVVYRAEAIQGGGLTTHRVVGETDRGFVTKGDNNPFTDQDGGEPPVKRAQVVATALQVNGQVVVVPHLGTVITEVTGAVSWVQQRLAILLGTGAVLGVQGLAYLLFGATLVLYVVDVYREGATGRRSRERTRDRNAGVNPRLVVGAIVAVVVLSATAAMVVPAGTQEYGVVSADFESDRPTVIPKGESKTVEYPVVNGGVVPVVSYVEPATDGVAVEPRRLRVGGGGSERATVTLRAPDRTGFYRRFVVEHRYLAVLPRPVIDALYRVHPWVPILAIDALVGVPFYVLGVRLVGTGRIRSRSREGPSTVRRIVSWLT